MRSIGLDEPTVLAGVATLLFLLGFLGIAMGELMAAGLSFLVATFVIYLREVRL